MEHEAHLGASITLLEVIASLSVETVTLSVCAK